MPQLLPENGNGAVTSNANKAVAGRPFYLPVGHFSSGAAKLSIQS